MVCRFYLAGSCSYGSRCRYDHVGKKTAAAAAAALKAEAGTRERAVDVVPVSSSSASPSGCWGPSPLPKNNTREARTGLVVLDKKLWSRRSTPQKLDNADAPSVYVKAQPSVHAKAQHSARPTKSQHLDVTIG